MSDEKKDGVIAIERQLGFRWVNGISRERSDSSQVPVISAFLDAIDYMNETYSDTLPKSLRTNAAFRRDCLRLFDVHGPELWPAPPTNTSRWLCDSGKNKLEGSWLRNLVYAEPDDRKILQPLFEECLWWKVVRYRGNQQAAQRKTESLETDRQLLRGDSDTHNRGSTLDPREEMENRFGHQPDYVTNQRPYTGHQYAPIAPMYASTTNTGLPRVFGQHTGGDTSTDTVARPDRTPVSPPRSLDLSDVYGVASSDSSPPLSLSEWSPPPWRDYDIDKTNAPATSSRKRREESSDGEYRPPRKISRAKTSSNLTTRSQRAESTSTNPRQQTSSNHLNSRGGQTSGQGYNPSSVRHTFHATVEEDHEEADSAGGPRITDQNAARERGPAAQVPATANKRAATVDAGAIDHGNDVPDTRARPQHTTPNVEKPNTLTQRQGQGSATSSSGTSPVELGATSSTPRAHSVSNQATASEIAKQAIDEVQKKSQERTLGGSSNVVRGSDENTQRDHPQPLTDTSTARLAADAPTSRVANATASPQDDANSVPDGARSTNRTSTTTPLQHTEANGAHDRMVANEVPNISNNGISAGVSPPPQPAQPTMLPPTTPQPTTEQPLTIQQRADALIWWDETADTNDILDLIDCTTHAKVFEHLDRLRPEHLEERKIKSAKFKIMNMDAAGLTLDPNCRVPFDHGEVAFQYLLRTLEQVAEKVRPQLQVTVQFHRQQ